jgi:hypothetical protein
MAANLNLETNTKNKSEIKTKSKSKIKRNSSGQECPLHISRGGSLHKGMPARL